MSHGALIALDIAGNGDPWGTLGFMVADEVTQVGDVTLRFGAEGDGIVGWALEGAAGPAELDGIPTVWLPEPVEPSAPREHRIDVSGVDHVVVASPDPPRAFRAFEAVGLPLRREAETGSAERPLRQGFFRNGSTIIEVVGPREVTEDGGPSRLWGITFVSDDLDALVAELGHVRCGPPRDAVQPGRRIAALRRAADLPTRVAFLTPD